MWVVNPVAGPEANPRIPAGAAPARVPRKHAPGRPWGSARDHYGSLREPADGEAFQPHEKRGPRPTRRRSGAPVGVAALRQWAAPCSMRARHH